MKEESESSELPGAASIPLSVMDVVLMGIIVIGVIGFLFDKLVLLLERKLTGWQEVK